MISDLWTERFCGKKNWLNVRLIYAKKNLPRKQDPVPESFKNEFDTTQEKMQLKAILYWQKIDQMTKKLMHVFL